MKYTYAQFKKDFPNDNACLKYIFKARFGNNPTCPKCKKTNSFYRMNKRRAYACSCGYQVYPAKDTIFHKSSTSLTSWFFAIYLMSSAKNGVSAKELQKHLGVSYKTALRIAHKIRSLMKQDDSMLEGVVEIDEMYVGGNPKRNLRKRCIKKTPVIGVVARNGKARAVVVEEADTRNALKLLKDNVKVGSKIMSDGSYLYRNKLEKLGFEHSSVKHSKWEYVRGNVHTNSIEGLWSQIKRSIRGTYHSVSPKYLQSYVDEFVYQYNHRSLKTSSLFETLLVRLCPQHGLKENESVAWWSLVSS